MFRERVTITLEPEVLVAIDSLIDSQVLRNRSHAIEHLLKEGLGLHQLEQAFLFFGDDWQQAQLEKVLELLAPLAVKQLFIVLPTASQHYAEISALIHAHSPDRFTLTQVPADFGSGGAVVLQKAQITQPILLITIDAQFHPPSSLLPAYTFHRQHHSILTEFVCYTGKGEHQAAGLVLANPELLLHIPAGIISLQETVYPALAKENNLRAYVFAE